MDVGDGNPGMDKRFDQNIEFGWRVLIQSQVLGGANREWMLVIEIRFWLQQSMRIFNLAEGFTPTRSTGGIACQIN